MPGPLHIDGDRAYLRAIEVGEALSILEGLLPEGLRFADGYPGEFAHEVMELFAGDRRSEPIGFTPMFILRREDDAVIGGIGWSFPDGPSAPSVGYDIVEPLWGQGYATDALRAVVAHLLAQPDIERVCADTLKTHVASRRVMEKAGMTLVREAIEDVDGGPQPLVYYEVRRPPPGVNPPPLYSRPL